MPKFWERAFQEAEKYDEFEEDYPLGDAFYRSDDYFIRLQRRQDSTERSFHRALESLSRAPEDPPPTPRKRLLRP